ncbi:MAG: hypothetical protein L0Z50_28085 [Verrucomicrobiales bacterium]|nr:hypothetical protein [Verrucomicrobiales bacterium]
MAEIPTSEPLVFFQGDTVKWKKSLADYRASEGWSLQYALTGAAGGRTVSTSASGDDFLATLAAADTLAIQHGEFKLIGFVSKAGERFKVFEGRVTVSANPLTNLDASALSSAETRLERLKTELDRRAGKQIGSQTSPDLTFSLVPYDELWRQYHNTLAEVQRERRALKLKQGLAAGNMILVRFA